MGTEPHRDQYSSREDVNQLLDNAKALIHMGRWHLEPRNIQAVANLGMTTDDVRDILLGLTVSDYCKGPHPDRDPQRPGDIWFFLATLSDPATDLYIKLKPHPRGIHVTVLSLHPPQTPIRRHFR